MYRLLTIVLLPLLVLPLLAAEPTAAERGYKSLTTTAFIPGFWKSNAVADAWKQWGVKQKPADYDAAFRERYGLHPAPYPNDGLPMGLRRADILLRKGIGADCMLCHGGSILGKSYVGLGNSTLDIQALFEDLAKASGLSGKLPFTFSNVRGTNEADGFGVYLLGFRNPDLTLREWKDLGLHDDICEDVPAWWLLKKKKTMYHTGATDARTVRSLMQFMMHPLTTREMLRQGRAGVPRHPAIPHQPGTAEVPVPDRSGEGREGRGDLQRPLREVPRHLRREMDLPEQGHSAGRDRHRPEAASRASSPTYGEAYAAVVVRPGAGRWAGRRQALPRDRGLPGPAARRRLGDRPVLPQRQRADARPRAQLEGPPAALHAQLPHRRGGLRQGEGRLEGDRAQGAARPRSFPRSSAARSTTRRSPAAATAATPSATLSPTRSARR